MKKPSWFRLIDLVSITFGGFLTAGLLIYAMAAQAKGPPGWQWIFVATAAAFFGIYLRFVWARKKWLDTFRWYPAYGFMVQCENWHPYDDIHFNSAVLSVVEAWSVVHPNTLEVLRRDIKWVWFKRDLNETPLNPAHQKVKGVTIAGGFTMYVDYDKPDDALKDTAFAHELGHVIHGNVTGNWNQEEHHLFMAAHGLT
jgi:hypothetical protein